ncbi:MAG: hypothetical protein ABJL99_26280 [Aliishimia sp.]
MQPIQPQLEQRLVDGLFETARRAPLEKALAGLGSFVMGTPGFILFSGHAITVIGSDAPLMCAMGKPVSQTHSSVPDPVLRDMGLQWVRAKDKTPANHRAIFGALLLRAGLLCRMLDRAYRHLEHRESGGKPILQHQLVKACFVESYSTAEQIRQEAIGLLDDTLMIDLDHLHDNLSVVTMKASKLMGGHGFLIGEVNSIEFLSMCLAGQAAQTPATKDRNTQVQAKLVSEHSKELSSCPL